MIFKSYKLFGFLAIVILNGCVSKVQTKIKESQIEATMRFLTDDKLLGRDSGSEGILQAANYLEKELKQAKAKPFFKTYKDTLSNFEPTAFNIVSWVEGNDPVLKNEFIIVGAHYDHIGIAKKAIENDSIVNGANDNASGSTAVLALAKYFGKSKTNKRSIIFVFFSAEEKGLLGSRHLAKKLKNQNLNVYTMLNFEMIGVPLQGKDYTAYITGYAKSNMVEKLNEYAGKNLIGFHNIELKYRLFMASDNYPFYTEMSIPAQTVCTFDFDNYAYYHHPSDELERMDIKHMTNFIQEMVPVVEGMSNAATQEIKLKN
uniref:M28 family metallopeptidase n=1 Tax=Flavobacterium sp. TaxID=239 RepID=UPI00404A8C97